MNADADKRPLSRRKKIVFSLAILFVLWLAVDFAAFVFLRKLGAERRIFFEQQVPTEAQLAGFGAKYFHPRWGWDIQPSDRGPLGERLRKERRYAAKPRYKLKAFGDSFTFGYHVVPKEAWSAQLEDRTGWDCINFGVAGYGTDQAVLKYEDSKLATDYTILGIYDEDIGRIMTRYYAFYDRGKTFYVKPRFTLEDGILVKHPAPIVRASDLGKLRDRDFLATLREEDYWHAYYRSLGAPPGLRWPATFTVVPHVGFFWRYGSNFVRNQVSPTYASRTSVNKYYHLFEEGSPGLELLFRITEHFVGVAKARGERPIVVMFPNVETVEITKAFSRCPYQPFVDRMKSLDCAFLDLGDRLAREPTDDCYLALAGRHLSARGNEVVAEELARLIESLDAPGPVGVPGR